MFKKRASGVKDVEPVFVKTAGFPMPPNFGGLTGRKVFLFTIQTLKDAQTDRVCVMISVINGLFLTFLSL